MAALVPQTTGPLPGFVPDGKQVAELSESRERRQKAPAYKLMLAVIYYDLSSEPVSRRVASAVDPDWQLYLDVAKRTTFFYGHQAKAKRL